MHLLSSIWETSQLWSNLQLHSARPHKGTDRRFISSDKVCIRIQCNFISVSDMMRCKDPLMQRSALRSG